MYEAGWGGHAGSRGHGLFGGSGVEAVIHLAFIVNPLQDDGLMYDIGPGGADPEMQFVHEDDAAEVSLKVVELGAEGFFHAAGEGNVRTTEVAKMAGKPVASPPVSDGEMRKAQRLGPRRSSREVVRMMLDTHRG